MMQRLVALCFSTSLLGLSQDLALKKKEEKRLLIWAKLGVYYLAFTSGVPLFGCVNISLPHNWLLLQARQ